MIDGYDKTLEEIYHSLDSQFEGLSSEEAESRLTKYGLNVIESERKISPVSLFFSQFKDLLVIILLIAGLINGIIGLIEMKMESLIDVIAIAVVVLLNAFLGFYQEYSAEKAIQALQSLSESEVIVVRDQHKQKIKSEHVVPGDIIQIESGNTIVADIRIIQGYEIRANESILTGESVTVRKRSNVLPEETTLAERKNMLFKGTTVVNGSGLGIVVKTGSVTELGKIASSLAGIEKEPTPIQKKLDKLAKQLTVVVAILSAIIFILGVISFGIQGWSFLLIFAIGLAVAAVPEGLPTVLTLSLALGITRMAKKNALIRKLPAVEVLGSTTVICTDKTGTLTRNEQTVRLIWTLDRKYNVTGDGYYKNGDIVEKGTAQKRAPIIIDGSLEKIIEIAALANEASIEGQGKSKPYKIFGDPTEVALLIAAEKGQTLAKIKEKWSVEYIFPFDSDRKRMSAIIKHKKTGQYRIVVKGALDILLDLCDKQLLGNREEELNDSIREDAFSISENYSGNYAYRILGMAYRDITPQEADRMILSERYEYVEQQLTFVGFIGMIDPPRSESKKAISQAFEAGMRVIMITGDHKSTAKAIGKEINLGMYSEPVTGKILDRMTDEELEQSVQTQEIYSRVTPEHKLRIVNALKNNGEIITMTGDGVNDAPALKRADIGVAMGITGTDVAKEASEMILVDDNFANIIAAVFEGRTIYNNIKKFIGYLLSANTGEILTVLFGFLIGLIFFRESIIPVLTIQLLYINIVTDTFPALALGVSPAEGNIMRQPPRDPEEPLLDKEMIIMIFTSGVSYAIGALFVYFWATDFTLTTDSVKLHTAQTMVFVSLVIYQLLHSLSLSQKDIIFNKQFFKNGKLFLAVLVSTALLLVAIYVPFLSNFIETQPLEALHWGIIFLTALPIFIIDEGRKMILKAVKKRAYEKQKQKIE